MRSKRPVILGHDMVSPLGTELAAQWQRALAGESGVGPLTRFAHSPGFPVEIAGQVPEIDASPYPFLSPRQMAHWTSPIFPHALLVVHRALARAGLEITDELSPRVGVTFGTAVGGLDAVLAADRALVARRRMPDPFANPNSCVNMVTGKVSILANATGPVLNPITACATGCTSMALGALLLDAGLADAVVCGAVDFPLVEPIIAGFATMNGAFKRKDAEPPVQPRAASRPFAVDRRGFVVSEGAGCVVLASSDFARAHGLRWSIELAGFCMNADAKHFVAPRLDTVARCMAEAIADAGIRPSDVDAVNAHATSTQVGDQVEADALHLVFGDAVPPVTANKSLIGHAMGASSAIESVLAMEAMLQGRCPPTINHKPDPALRLDAVVGDARRLDQTYVLKNAFGFGGSNCCVVLHRVA